MKKNISFSLFFYLVFLATLFSQNQGRSNIYSHEVEKSIKSDQTIFAFGGDIKQKFIQYVVDLTNKPNPRICYLPTASADNADNIKYWNFICKNLSIEPFVLKVWVSSNPSSRSFEEVLLGMDAIVVGGGNTLNMMGIWKAQGIDTILRKALDKGIILAGGSAGSICWFQNGISDSRPVSLSVVNGLSFLPYSNCPHFADSLRRDLYFKNIKNKMINEGYAFDDLSGVLFRNGRFIEAVSLNDVNNSYYVTLKKGAINAERIHSKIFVNRDALPANSYTVLNLDKAVKDFAEVFDQSTPLNAFISLKYLFANGQLSKQKQVSSFYLQKNLSDTTHDIKVNVDQQKMHLNTTISKVLVFKDLVAGIINKMYDGFYGLWYFYYENGKWVSAGEDIGGESIMEAEITFREKAKMHLKKIKKEL